MTFGSPLNMIRNFIVSCLLLASLNLQAAPAQLGFWQKTAVTANIVVQNAWKGGVGSGTSCTVTVSPTAGNLMVVVIAGYLGTVSNHAVSDNIDGTTGWVAIAEIASASAANNISMWYKKNVPSGVTTLTLDGGASTLAINGNAHEVSGCSTTAPFTSGEYSATSSSPVATTNPVTGSATNATANSIFFACCGNIDSSNPTTFTINQTGTVGTWNLFSSTNSQELNGANRNVISVPNIIVSSGTAEAHGWTSASRGDQKMIIAAFHP